jgi:hypothetical protein
MTFFTERGKHKPVTPRKGIERGNFRLGRDTTFMKPVGMKHHPISGELVETIDDHDIKMIYGNRKPEGHFFDKDTMRFFDSRLSGKGYKIIPTKNVYFITSEQYHDSQGSRPRKYSIRVIEKEGNVKTIGEFQQYDSMESAKNALNKIIDSEIKNYTYSH